MLNTYPYYTSRERRRAPSGEPRHPPLSTWKTYPGAAHYRAPYRYMDACSVLNRVPNRRVRVKGGERKATWRPVFPTQAGSPRRPLLSMHEARGRGFHSPVSHGSFPSFPLCAAWSFRISYSTGSTARRMGVIKALEGRGYLYIFFALRGRGGNLETVCGSAESGWRLRYG